MGQVSVYWVDLTNIEGDGDFPCPSCGAQISPDDESETTYQIVSIKEKADGSLEELSIVCKKCKSTIHIKGFEMLKELNTQSGSDES